STTLGPGGGGPGIGPGGGDLGGAAAGGGGGGLRGGPPIGGGGQRSGAPPGLGGQGAPPGFGAPGGGGASAQQSSPTIKQLRVVITTTDGKKSEAYVPITSSSGERGWKTVAVPLQRIAGLDKTNKQIRSIALSADSTGTFYVGDITVLTDATPITGEPNYRSLNLALGDEVEFIANGFGGSSILRYSWDFDARDGIQEDAEGQSVRRKFRRPGDYTVTLTISDAFGLKKPYSTTIKVTVNP
ncbi:MAG TPA: PKD domain-containing protein, partial [Fimbriimonadaceae bacterium]|nr:PKD domain-containing protein [Fimbriimonadaceae bacterium]